MELITKKDLMDSLLERWNRQYRSNFELADGQWVFDKTKKLSAKNLTEKKANKIIGNKGWTANICDECEKDIFATVELGQKLGYDSATAKICLSCLKKAIKLFPV